MTDLIGFLFGSFVLTIAVGAIVAIVLKVIAAFGRPKASRRAQPFPPVPRFAHGMPEAGSGASMWGRVLSRLQNDLPSSWASSCPVPLDLEDAFKIMDEANRRIHEATWT
jgi:hypothetical protein